ncbi:uncharacterized protein LOC111753013 [Loxodonta africana]|uniref:uncharacterized protein LOC111753013 n=1 Tax=Loxodonta africana TaxID=9785 RepID=UPI000C812FCE|nr:uncharacterized protein LOC111753013 [Loxodonta africana]XP_023414527.1 uncharacterized protein LOC111753013 [Loxodonta africana]
MSLKITRCREHRCHAFPRPETLRLGPRGRSGSSEGSGDPAGPGLFPWRRRRCRLPPWDNMFKRMAGFGPDTGRRVTVSAGPRLPSGGGCHGLAPPSVVRRSVGRFVSLSRLLSSGLNRGLKAGGESEADVTASLQPPAPPKANVITDDLEVVAEETGHLAGWGILAWCSPAPAQVIRKRGMPPPGCEDNNGGSKYRLSAYRLPKEAKHSPML